ncbi:MAG: hypothetical protein WCH34_06085 [Bacteroidota bacterium]
MDLLIKIKENSLESDIISLINYLKSQNCVKKFDVRADDLNSIKSISDKETINAMHLTSSKALANFLENEKESIF